MAQDLGNDFSGGLLSWSASLFGSDITDNNSATSAAEDLGAQTGIALGFEIKLAGSTGTVDGVVTILIAWSRDNTDFETAALADVIGHITPVASSTVIKCPSTPIRGRYFKIVASNTSGITITTSSTIDYEVIYGNQV